jgi:hypothetical protein
MATVYKVWQIIEAYDTETQSGEELDGPGTSMATFRDGDAAWEFAERVQAAGERLAVDAPGQCDDTYQGDDQGDDQDGAR